MPELTRLRRNIRGSSDNWIADLEALLDAADQGRQLLVTAYP